MRRTAKSLLAGAILLLTFSHTYAEPSSHPKKHRNAIIFIADGLRPGSVNTTDAPTLLSVRNPGRQFYKQPCAVSDLHHA